MHENPTLTIEFFNIFYRDVWTPNRGGPVNSCLSVCPSICPFISLQLVFLGICSLVFSGTLHSYRNVEIIKSDISGF